MSVKANKRVVRVGSRESVLAVAQTRIVMDAVSRRHPEIEFELVTMKTQGDRFSAAYPTAAQPEGKAGKEIVKGLFVKELETALADGRIDFAVHSLKDMSVFENPALPIVAISPREVPYDVAVFKKGTKDGGIFSVSELAGMSGGCSSARRRLQIQRAVFSQPCQVKPIRGNIITRMEKLDSGDDYDFLILAAAGLLRLGMQGRIGFCFDESLILPAVGQGVLACQGRAGERYDYLEDFHDEDVAACVTAERAFAAATGGGCSSPVAAFAKIQGEDLRLDGLFADEEKNIFERGQLTGSREEPKRLGETLAARLLK